MNIYFKNIFNCKNFYRKYMIISNHFVFAAAHVFFMNSYKKDIY